MSVGDDDACVRVLVSCRVGRVVCAAQSLGPCQQYSVLACQIVVGAAEAMHRNCPTLLGLPLARHQGLPACKLV